MCVMLYFPKPLSVELTFDVDSAGYPWSVYGIYPEVPERPVTENVGAMVKLDVGYPVFNICE